MVVQIEELKLIIAEKEKSLQILKEAIEKKMQRDDEEEEPRCTGCRCCREEASSDEDPAEHPDDPMMDMYMKILMKPIAGRPCNVEPAPGKLEKRERCSFQLNETRNMPVAV